jgi:hypothetical protein
VSSGVIATHAFRGLEPLFIRYCSTIASELGPHPAAAIVVSSL